MWIQVMWKFYTISEWIILQINNSLLSCEKIYNMNNVFGIFT